MTDTGLEEQSEPETQRCVRNQVWLSPILPVCHSDPQQSAPVSLRPLLTEGPFLWGIVQPAKGWVPPSQPPFSRSLMCQTHDELAPFTAAFRDPSTKKLS